MSNSRFRGEPGGPNFGPITTVGEADREPWAPPRPELPQPPQRVICGELFNGPDAPVTAAQPEWATARPPRGESFGDPGPRKIGGSLPSFQWIGR